MKIYVPRSTRVAAAVLVLGAVAYLGFFRRPAAGPVAAAPAGALAPPSALEAYEEDVTHRMAVRRNIVSNVIDRRLSLDEAAAQFQELDSLSGTFNWDAFRRATPGSSDEERQRRAVIAHVESQLVNDRAESQAVVPRLEAELQAFLGKNASGRPEGASARGRAEPTH